MVHNITDTNYLIAINYDHTQFSRQHFFSVTSNVNLASLCTSADVSFYLPEQPGWWTDQHPPPAASNPWRRPSRSLVALGGSADSQRSGGTATAIKRPTGDHSDNCLTSSWSLSLKAPHLANQITGRSRRRAERIHTVSTRLEAPAWNVLLPSGRPEIAAVLLFLLQKKEKKKRKQWQW